MGEKNSRTLKILGGLAIPRLLAADWDAASAKVALHEVRRLRGELAAAEAVLIAALKTETGRDTKATLARSFNMSNGEAARAEQVAEVVSRIPGAADALADGSVTGEHLRRLVPIADVDEAAALFVQAAGQTAEEFAETVDRHRIESDANGRQARQRAARSLRFFPADEGCVGMRAILPAVDGELVRGAIETACNAAWRTAHPERAAVAGGHGNESADRRMADAFVELVTGSPAQFAAACSSGVGSSGVGARGGAGRTAVIITVQAETLEANLLGSGPISLDEALGAIDHARADLYAAIQSADGAVLKFGRSRRWASPMQKLALALRERGRCAWEGCQTVWSRCDADHDPPFEDGGQTDLTAMRLLCANEHHSHRHETGRNITRQRDGTWTVDGEEDADRRNRPLSLPLVSLTFEELGDRDRCRQRLRSARAGHAQNSVPDG